jgi:hypothetical protein
LSNLASLTRQTFKPLLDVKKKIKEELDIDISDNDLQHLKDI